MACVSSYWLLSLGLMGLTFGDITNIKINDHSPFWLGSNESFQDFPESSVPSDDDTDGVGTTTAEFPVASDDFDLRQDFGQNEDLSTSYTPGYCRCINKYYCNGANYKVVRAKRAVNNPPCRNRDDVMCCLTTGPGCGVPANFPFFNPYPLYGEANFGDHPWTALVMDTNNQVIYGLGIVISWRIVLTTARNVQHLQSGRSGRLKVRLGEWDLSSNDEPFKPQEFGVSEIIIHPNFNPRTYQNDIAILRLTNFVDLSSFPSIRSGCVAKPNDVNKFAGAKCLVSGWGVQPSLRQRVVVGNKNPAGVGGRPISSQQQQQVPPAQTLPTQPNPPPGQGAGQTRNILKEVDLQMVEGNVCQDALRKNVGDPQFLLDQKSFLCAGGDHGKGLCKGDEGGALVCKDRRSERYTVVGMASWGTTCGQAGFPVVFTNVASYYEWIKSVDPQIGQ
ncbi:phenoloxidase-activating factor 2 [Folsomia candida]|uniref:phenoloxidase-activating factor 2 n=1 Tax=Folsomia candida TaxID=158441 RepID=UPI000B907075|nr:phenoloxidase-activating factor 2 [Folsomia candida]